MEFLDLTKLTPKQREDIESIVGNNKSVENVIQSDNSIKEEYLSGSG